MFLHVRVLIGVMVLPLAPCVSASVIADSSDSWITPNGFESTGAFQSASDALGTISVFGDSALWVYATTVHYGAGQLFFSQDVNSAAGSIYELSTIWVHTQERRAVP